jgi:hypothetical protein
LNGRLRQVQRNSDRFRITFMEQYTFYFGYRLYKLTCLMKLNNRKYALSILIGIFLVLITTSSFFHNHAPSIKEPTSCPVFIFQTILATAIISLFIFALSRLDKSEYLVFYTSSYIPKKIPYHQHTNRAPPENLH